MKGLLCVLLVLATALAVHAQQEYEKQIFETERAFERSVAERGIRDGFIEFLSPLGVIFRPEPVNGREWWGSRPASPASLTWNPIRIEVSSNGALGYSIGNSIYKPKGKPDTEEFYGHYLSIWARQPNGEYRAALDAGIDHPKPSRQEPGWTAGGERASETNPKNLFAGDSSIGFFRLAENRGLARAYKAYAAEDIFLMRADRVPFVGRDAAVDHIEETRSSIRFAKRRSFIEAGDLAYVHSTYSLVDKQGVEESRGNFIQVWRLRNGKWLIVADLFLALAAARS